MMSNYVKYACETACVCYSARKRGRPRKSEREKPKSSATVRETVSVPEQSKMDADVHCVSTKTGHVYYAS